MIRGALSGLLVGTMRRRGASFGPGSGVGGGPSTTLDLNFAAMAASGTLDSRVTYTGASLATLTDATGAIAYKPHNLLTWSGDLTNWNGANDGLTATTVVDSSSSLRQISMPVSIPPSSLITARALVAKTTGNLASSMVGVYLGGAVYSTVCFDTTTGEIVARSTEEPTSFSCVPYDANTWLISFSKVSAASTASASFYICPAWRDWAPTVSNAVFNATSTKSLTITALQINIGPLQPYYPTTSAAYFGPRFTYDPITHAALGLLIEEQRTNLLTYSEAFDNAAWISSGMTISSNAIAAPDGLTTADQITLINGSHSIRQNPDATVAASTQYTLSFYAYRGTATDAKYAVFDNTHAAYIFTSTSFFAQMSASGWSRVTVTFTTPAGCTSIRPVLLSDSGVTGTIYLWGAQLEAGAFATSYIPTTSASVTRAADSATMTGSNFSSWYNSTQGTLVVNAISNSIGTNNEGTATIYQDATNTIGVGRRYAGGGLTTISLFVYTGGATQAYAQSGTISVGAPYKSAARYAANDFAISVNGDAPTTDVAGTPPSSPTSLLIGRTYANEYSSGPIARLRYYPVALTNAQLQALTT